MLSECAGVSQPQTMKFDNTSFHASSLFILLALVHFIGPGGRETKCWWTLVSSKSVHRLNYLGYCHTNAMLLAS